MRGRRASNTRTHRGHSCCFRNISNSQVDDPNEFNNYIPCLLKVRQPIQNLSIVVTVFLKKTKKPPKRVLFVLSLKLNI